MGKGGVGKTTASLFFSADRAREGRRVLFVELGERSDASAVLGIPPLTYSPTKIEKNLWAIRISGIESLKEYLRPYRLLFENRPIRYFFDVAPGLKDLMVLLKIVHEAEHAKAPGPYDHVVVDAPATGHALFLFQSPPIVKRLARFGPIFERAKHIADVLASDQRTSVHVVSLARPVVAGETLEMLAELRRVRLPIEELIINRILLESGADLPLEARNETIRLLAKRAKSELREIRHLRRLAKCDVRLIPEMDVPKEGLHG